MISTVTTTTVTTAVKPTTVVTKTDVCEPRLPTLVISPATITRHRGGRDHATTAEYEVTVSDNDSTACTASTFNLTLSVVSPTSMELNVDALDLKLNPGQSATTAVVGTIERRSNGDTQIAATLSGSSLGVVSASR